MGYSMPDLLKKKGIDNQPLSQEEMKYFVDLVKEFEQKTRRWFYKDANLPIQKEQIGAMLMAIRIRGLDNTETDCLTREMVKSGNTLEWPDEWKGCIVDKHSTGGVGDKVSLVLAPVLAACGVKVPMVSGRALEHTGGTLDKLESIPGFKIDINNDHMKNILTDVGCCIVFQSSNPVDKILYSARDVTSTVKEFGLITGSIISKKVVESPDALILDVKYGKGAFCDTKKEARELAKTMVSTGKSFGVKTTALLTDMNSPLGYKIGNALEVEESIQCLKGNGPAELTELVRQLGGRLLVSVNKASDLKDAIRQIDQSIHNGKAIKKFHDMMIAQKVTKKLAEQLCGSDSGGFESLIAKPIEELKADKSGYVHGIDAKICGVVSTKLSKEKSGKGIRHHVGLTLTVGVGDKIEKGSPWVKVHDDQKVPDELIKKLREAIDIKPERKEPTKRLLDGDIIE